MARPKTIGRPAIPLPSLARLHELLDYDPETGVFTARVDRGPARMGSIVGCRGPGTYWVASIDGRKYRLSRIAWKMVTGSDPVGTIDHEDTDRGNNRFRNLRDIPQAINNQNRRSAYANNAIGLLGVCRHGKRFKATILLNKVKRHIGVFDTPQEAHAAFVAVKREIHSGCTL